MKASLISLILVLMFIFTVPKISAQTASGPKRPDDQRWISHQMFQPPPNDAEKQKISEKVIEEIKRLYIEAEKEKTTQNHPDAKPQKR